MSDETTDENVTRFNRRRSAADRAGEPTADAVAPVLRFQQRRTGSAGGAATRPGSAGGAATHPGSARGAATRTGAADDAATRAGAADDTAIRAEADAHRDRPRLDRTGAAPDADDPVVDDPVVDDPAGDDPAVDSWPADDWTADAWAGDASGHDEWALAPDPDGAEWGPDESTVESSLPAGLPTESDGWVATTATTTRRAETAAEPLDETAPRGADAMGRDGDAAERSGTAGASRAASSAPAPRGSAVSGEGAESGSDRAVAPVPGEGAESGSDGAVAPVPGEAADSDSDSDSGSGRAAVSVPEDPRTSVPEEPDGPVSGDSPVLPAPVSLADRRRRRAGLASDASPATGVDVPIRWADPTRISFAGDPGSIDETVPPEPTAADAPPELEAILADAEASLLKALRRADKSRAEARALLEADPELGEGHIEELLDRFTELGYLDDERLAERLADQLTERKGQGAVAVRRALQARKLDALAIEQALAAIDDDAEDERAFEIARQRASRLGGVDEEAALRRLVGFLQRRGFDGSLSLRAARAALSGGGGPRSRRGGRSSGVYFGNGDD